MPRLVLYTTVLALFAFFGRAEAANTINWTFYGPGAAGWMQGPMTASAKDFEGSSNAIHTLDDVRTGKSKYVTLASATVMKGRFYCIGTVTYTSPPMNGGDGKTHTIENVIGYVHDTGCAFNGTCSCAKLPQYCDGRPRTDKMDIAVGNFNGASAEYAMNYITKNPNRAPASWTQIAGIPQQGSQSAALSPCGGQVKEDGTPVSATYTPPPSFAPQNPLQSTQPGTQPAQQPTQQPYPYQPQSAPTGGTVPSAQNGGTLQYTQSPAYAPIPQTPVPQTSVPSSILTSLFQQSSATSGIRVVQNAAQMIADLFALPNTTTGQSIGNPAVASTVPAIIYDENNVSLMALSQIDDASDAPAPAVPYVDPRPDTVRSGASQQVSTFAAGTETHDPLLSTTTQSIVLSILASFRTLLQSIVHVFLSR